MNARKGYSMKRRKTKSERREARVTIRLTEEQRKMVQQVAAQKGLDESEYIRMVVVESLGSKR